MDDLEKVVKGLECCIPEGTCEECPYTLPEYGTCESLDELLKDALALLKADLQAQREAQAAIETEVYMEQWEPTYNPEDGSL